MEVYSTPAFKDIRAKCIAQDLSWAQPARKWEAILTELMHGCATAGAKKQTISTPVQKILA